MLEFLRSNAGVVIAVSALALTIIQAQITRRHHRLTVRPHLTSFTFTNKSPGKGVLVYKLLNKGIGPAFIKRFAIYLDNKAIASVEIALTELLSGHKFDHKVTTLSTDYAMSPGEEKDLLAIVIQLKENVQLEQIEKQLNRLDLVVEYQSAYKEPFRLDTRNKFI